MTYDVIVIGSGPAGYTAAIYTSRAGLSTLVLEGFNAGGYPPGGQLTTTPAIYNYPGAEYGISGVDLMDRMRNQVIECGAVCEMETVTKVEPGKPNKIITEDGNTYESKYVVVASGASAKRLDFAGSKFFWGKGISTCAVCDGSNLRYKEGTVVIIGGGDSAASMAMYLAGKAQKVLVLARRDFRMSKASMAMLSKYDNVELRRNTIVTACGGEDWIENIAVIDSDSNAIEKLPCVGLFFAVGHTPNTDFMPSEYLDKRGYVMSSVVNQYLGIYAAGDVCSGSFKQGIVAAGQGAEVALRIIYASENEQNEKE